MMANITARTRRLTLVAQDPAVRTPHGRILCVSAEIPAEALDPGPWGHRVQVIDFDATTNQLLAPLDSDAYIDRNGSLYVIHPEECRRTCLPRYSADADCVAVERRLANPRTKGIQAS
jgi:hypothetical protein